jgi:hypothetical protein
MPIVSCPREKEKGIPSALPTTEINNQSTNRPIDQSMPINIQSISNHELTTGTVFLILVLQKLAQMSEGFAAIRALVWQVGYDSTIVAASIRKHWLIRNEVAHPRLARGKLVNILPGIVSSKAACAMSTLDVLDGIGTRAKPGISTNRARDILWTMNLHVHVHFILRIEFSLALVTTIRVGHNMWTDAICLVRRRGSHILDTVFAFGPAIALHPLIPAELTTGLVITTIGARSAHLILMKYQRTDPN